MIGAGLGAIAIALTIMVLWKRMTLFVLGAVVFWLATLDYFLNSFKETPSAIGTTSIPERVILAILAIVIGLFVWGLFGRQATDPIVGDIGSPLRKFIRRINGERINTPRAHRETEEEYRTKVYKALHPNRIQKR